RVRYVQFDLHWQWWTFRDEGQARQRTVEELNKDIAQENSEARILSLDETPRDAQIEIAKVYPPETSSERELLVKLKQAAEAEILAHPRPQASAVKRAPPQKGPAERELLEAAINEAEAGPAPVF